ncbi:MAG: hypothetical protein ACM32K_01620 [Syntrophaceae bacterium]
MSVPPGEPAGHLGATGEAMGIEVNVTREFVVNGKRYHSLEEVPPDIRQAVENTLLAQGVPQEGTAGNQAKIMVNGRPYGSVDAMPGGVREIYAVAMQCIGSGPAPKPIAPQGASLLSGRWVMAGSLLLCLLVSLLLLLLPR